MASTNAVGQMKTTRLPGAVTARVPILLQALGVPAVGEDDPLRYPRADTSLASSTSFSVRARSVAEVGQDFLAGWLREEPIRTHESPLHRLSDFVVRHPHPKRRGLGGVVRRPRVSRGGHRANPRTRGRRRTESPPRFRDASHWRLLPVSRLARRVQESRHVSESVGRCDGLGLGTVRLS